MKKIIFSFLITGLFGSLCLISVPTLAQNEGQAALENELSAIETQISALQRELTTTKSQKNTLNRRINQLRLEQRTLELRIRTNTLTLQKLATQIDENQNNIHLLEAKRERFHIRLGLLLRLLNQSERSNFLLQLFHRNGLSAGFNEAKNFLNLSMQIQSLANDLKNTQQKLHTDQTALSEKQDNLDELLHLSALESSALKEKLNEQKTLLQTTQGKEIAYQSEITNKKQQAQTIRTRLYELVGGGQQITFGAAVNIAQVASQATGVPTPFLLAILTQESNLGKNVGTCNRPTDPPEKSWKVIMKPDRDQEPFKTITQALGRDIDATPVSCPMRDKTGQQIGWGGAMGPAQFIPSTWIKYQDKVSALTGKTPANPWDIRDAFMAAALLLKANGAQTSSDSQWAAAMRYFSGSTNPRFRFYGDNVMTLVAKYTEDIQNLQP